jgi:DNA-binding protein HU-beta
MTKTQLIEKIAEKGNLSKKDAEAALKAFILTVNSALSEGDEISLVGFGNFSVRERKARQGHNPKNPSQIVDIKACKVPVFRAGKLLREAVNK